jgi:preprotein translocase SecE subunit
MARNNNIVGLVSIHVGDPLPKGAKDSGAAELVKAWKKIKKLCTDTFNEMKKVVWTPKAELKKSTVLVIVAVVCVAAAIAVVDSVFSFAINGIAGLFPIL